MPYRSPARCTGSRLETDADGHRRGEPSAAVCPARGNSLPKPPRSEQRATTTIKHRSNRAKYRQGRADALRDYGHIRPGWTIAPDGGLAELPRYSEDPYRQGYLLGMVYAYKRAGKDPEWLRETARRRSVRGPGGKQYTLAEVVDEVVYLMQQRQAEIKLLPTPRVGGGRVDNRDRPLSRKNLDTVVMSLPPVALTLCPARRHAPAGQDRPRGNAARRPR